MVNKETDQPKYTPQRKENNNKPGVGVISDAPEGYTDPAQHLAPPRIANISESGVTINQ